MRVSLATSVCQIDGCKEVVEFVAKVCVFSLESLAINRIAGIDAPAVFGKQCVQL